MESRESDTNAHRPGLSWAGMPHTILVVDDAPSGSVTDDIDSHPRRAAIVVRTGIHEALEYLKSDAVCAVVLEPTLSTGDGLELIARTRALPDLASMPFVIFTKDASDDAVMRGYDARANAFVRKPTTPAEMTAVVSSIVTFWGRVNHPPPRTERT